MKYILAILLLCAAAQAEAIAAATGPLPDTTNHRFFYRPFWTLENKVGFSILGSLVAADGITTQRGLSRGFRQANPLMRPFVTRGAAGEASGSALGFRAGLGAVYLTAPCAPRQSRTDHLAIDGGRRKRLRRQ